jgi:hypothetical protein
VRVARRAMARAKEQVESSSASGSSGPCALRANAHTCEERRSEERCVNSIGGTQERLPRMAHPVVRQGGWRRGKARGAGRRGVAWRTSGEVVLVRGVHIECVAGGRGGCEGEVKLEAAPAGGAAREA